MLNSAICKQHTSQGQRIVWLKRFPCQMAKMNSKQYTDSARNAEREAGGERVSERTGERGSTNGSKHCCKNHCMLQFDSMDLLAPITSWFYDSCTQFSPRELRQSVRVWRFCLHRFSARQSDFPDFLFSIFFFFLVLWCRLWYSISDSSNPLGIIYLFAISYEHL